jgi:hypothetical protein
MQKTDCHGVERKQKNKATAKDKQKKKTMLQSLLVQWNNLNKRNAVLDATSSHFCKITSYFQGSPNENKIFKVMNNSN